MKLPYKMGQIDLKDAMAVAGIALIGGGVWMMDHAIALITIGVILMAFWFLISRRGPPSGTP